MPSKWVNVLLLATVCAMPQRSISFVVDYMGMDLMFEMKATEDAEGE
jgi:hypothetical protein